MTPLNPALLWLAFVAALLLAYVMKARTK